MATEADAIAKLARDSATAPIVKTEDGRSFLIKPPNYSSEEVTDPHGLKPARPRYIQQEPTIAERDSLVTYVNRYKTPETVLFADITASRIVAVLDYHGASNAAAEGPANHAAHRAALTLPFSEEWKDWSGIDGKLVSQTDFARFLKEHMGDVVAPSGADLLEVCADLQSTRKVNFKQAVRTNTDAESFEYSVDSNVGSASGKAIEVPEKFKLGIPVYFGESATELFAYLRWNITDHGQLSLGVKLSRAEYVRQAVFKTIVADVGGRTATPIVYGSLAA